MSNVFLIPAIPESERRKNLFSEEGMLRVYLVSESVTSMDGGAKRAYDYNSNASRKEMTNTRRGNGCYISLCDTPMT